MEKLKMHSPDLTKEYIVRLLELFPNCVTEAKTEGGTIKRMIDFDQLRQELSDQLVEGPPERFHLNWPGKGEAKLVANAPIAKTLRPCREESVDFDTTKNLFIEGDNLDALKLLQESYLNKVKLIYIDPPYNTGNDFVYSDDFVENTDDFLRRSNQRDEAENRLVSNPETSGRFHSDWLSMIYPRLRLASNLLKDDGVILISIDDGEVHNLRKLCDEVFGKDNFIACMVWEKGRKNDAKLVSVGHEYILIYARSMARLKELGVKWREEKPGAREIWEQYVKLRSKHGKNDRALETDLQAWYATLPKSHPAKKWSRYKRVDEHGPWRDRDISWPGGGGPRYDVLHPITGQPCKVPERGWIYATHAEMQRQIRLGLVEFRSDHTEPPFRKAHIRPIADELDDADIDESEARDEGQGEEEFANQVRGSYFYKQSQVSVKALRALMEGKVFNNPKDHEEIARLVDYTTSSDPDAIIMDFFAGSGTTGHSVWELNAKDGGRRRMILVQLPEQLDPGKKDQKVPADYCDKMGKPRTIAELTKERLRRAGAKFRVSEKQSYLSTQPSLLSPLAMESEVPPLDIGFRVLKVDTSNMKDVYYKPDGLNKDDLFEHIENIKEDRTPEDLLFQVLLDWGVDISLRISQEIIDGKTVFFVDENALAACFDPGITEELVKKLASRKPLRTVFRDSGYGSDAVKINVEQIFKLISPGTEVKSI
jgi:adenine-specific DNA-methyltransferase